MGLKKILLITYYLPPNPSVGSRRWVKFAKNLKRNGHDVIIISAQPSPDMQSPWDEDIKDLNIHYLPDNYPTILGQAPQSAVDKVKYKLALKRLQLTVTGTVYDRTIFWEKPLLNLAERLITQHEIDTIITNGPPFRLMYYATQLKQRHPHIQLLSDFRDPWTWWHNMGYADLKGKHKTAEDQMERTVVEESDITLVPNSVMQAFLQKKYPEQTGTIKVLPHAYDEDEFLDFPEPAQQAPPPIRMVYFGTLYNGLEQEYEELAATLAQLKPAITLDIFTHKNDYRDVFEKHDLNDIVTYHKALPIKNLLKQMGTYHYVFILSPDFTKENVSTKFYEIARTGVPFLFVSNPGKASSFITENQLGIHLTPDQLKSGLNDLVKGKISHTSNRVFSLTQYSFAAQTKVLEEMLGLADNAD